jgi:DNA-binding PadR family transcriptional regulator
MFELRLLALVFRYPHPTALARKVQDGALLFPTLRSLECRGFVRRRRGEYRVTQRGRDELVMASAIARLVSRAV